MGHFKELRVWQDAVGLAERIYIITRDGSFVKDFGLKDQIQRAAVSVASNIAEGDERGSQQDGIRFLHMAKGSAAELITQLNIACRIGYLNQKLFDELENEAEKVRASIKNLIQYRSNNNKDTP